MGWFRRAVWSVDQAGRLLTVVTIIGFAIGTAAVLAAVVHALSKLSEGWLVTLGVGIGILVVVSLTVAVVHIRGSGFAMVQPPDASWVSQVPNLGQTSLNGYFLLTNTDPDHTLRSVGITIERYKAAGSKYKEPIDGTIIWPSSEVVDIPSHGTARRTVAALIPALPQVAPVEAKVRITDQYGHGHKGKLTFKVPPTPAQEGSGGDRT